MVETGLVLEKKDEFQEIMEHIRNGNNFLLSGGAGSGKTYSLVQVIKQVIEDNPTSKVACMTYTNAAVKEIEERVNHDNLNVTTIHDFLWDNIKHFQKELKSTLVELINDVNETKIKIDNETVLPDYFNSLDGDIQYKEYLRLKEGIISHDELLIIANSMFHSFPKLCDILKDRYQFIFIDEYQDTHKEVIEIFLTHLNQSKKKNIIGFFGDAMQSIYPDGIGNLDDYKGTDAEKVKEVKKEQNRRNPKLVYELANRLRVNSDGLVQTHSDDNNAPNMSDGTVKDGNIKFAYSNDGNLQTFRDYLGWDFSDSKQTKELNLTHNLIAGKAGFRGLMEIYDRDRIIELKNKITKKIKEDNIEISDDATFGEVIDQVNLTVNPSTQIGMFIAQNNDLYTAARNYKFSDFRKIYLEKDQLLDDKKQDKEDENKKGSKRDHLIKHLFKIQNIISLYQNKKYNEFLRITDFKYNFNSIEQKRLLQKNINELINVGDKTIEQIITEANEKGICLIDDNLLKFITEKKYVYNRVKNIKFTEFQKLYDYLEGATPFSTQHKTKGDEFSNVLVILDNGKWNDYNFEYLFLNTGTLSVLERTQKIFYVCCTRAKDNLGVYYHNPKPTVIEKAKELFGADNVVCLD
ncbi:ATP-dependent helicase [Flavobacterium ranwuense]|uniref:ATP-dependent helicase n=1 Tax=Flavobacterium ranwuense TaxID=2541725 RepID=A0ABY2DRH5_9FLAO|nr:ATP-dependent helicase [Flavobacterium ranwuense]TDE29307.1 ATP-dependent helicase [Flavobacterium ranwuense]